MQVYSPPQGWPFCTRAILAMIRHLAPEGTPAASAEDTAKDIHAWPTDQAQGPAGRRPPGGVLGRKPQTCGNALAARRRNGTPLPTGGHGSGRPDGREMGREGGAIAAGLLGPPTLVLARGHSGPCHPNWHRGLPTTPVARHPPPQPASGGSLGSMEREQASGPLLPHGTGQAILHTDGMGTADWEAILPDTACWLATATAQQPLWAPWAGHRLLQTIRPLASRHANHFRRVTGNAGPPQGMDDSSRHPSFPGTGAKTAQGPHAEHPSHPTQGIDPDRPAHRRGPGSGTGTSAGILTAGLHLTGGHVQLTRSPGPVAPR